LKIKGEKEGSENKKKRGGGQSRRGMAWGVYWGIAKKGGCQRGVRKTDS